MGDESRKFYALQFHPEVTHTPAGVQILRNFVELSGCTLHWTAGNFVEASLSEIRARKWVTPRWSAPFQGA